jgi:hypothetical protein
VTVTIGAGFDGESYIAKYEDVRRAVETGEFPSGYAHYVAFGKAEGRDSSATITDSRLSNSVELGGIFYQSFLKRMHAVLKPNNYFEIGALNGDILKRRRAPASRSIQFFKYHRMYLATNPHAISLRLAATISLTNEIPKKYFMVLSILLSLMACIYSNICCAIFMIQNDFARNIPSLFSTIASRWTNT